MSHPFPSSIVPCPASSSAGSLGSFVVKTKKQLRTQPVEWMENEKQRHTEDRVLPADNTFKTGRDVFRFLSDTVELQRNKR